jgi:NOL1/NOP2/sun family putative RNA methylase
MPKNKLSTPIDLPIPLAFLDSMQSLLASEATAFAESFKQPATLGLRANTLKIQPDELHRRLPLASQPVPWCPAGFSVENDISLGKHPYHAAGLYYLQEPSAMAVAEILAPLPGEAVLDLSAAPGGKATHLASLMQNQGLLVANEIHPQRAWELAENLERWGVRHTVITNETPQRLADRLDGFFDRVLVDAPCSGEGMFRKSLNARRDWSPTMVKSCALRQEAILEQAVRLLRPGGWLAYSTCTFNPQENEGVIARFLDAHPGVTLRNPPIFAGFDQGNPDWSNPSQPELSKTVRIWPHHAPGEGHFVALLQKVDEERFQTLPSNTADHRLSPATREAFDDFIATTCYPERLGIDPARLAQVGSFLYAIPEIPLNLAGLKVIHPGWWLGTFKKDRFEPSHALALSLTAAEARQQLTFRASDPELQAYLRGETLTQAGDPGWLLVTVDGYALGWGKRVQEVIKNYYPRGLRRYR